MLRRYCRHRRGSIFITVIGASLLVATIGISAVLVMRVQGRAVSMSNDFAEARLHARSAIDLGMYYIQTDSQWRISRGNGAWATDIAVGSGRFSLEAADPIDNDVCTGDNHPVVLTGTGRKGEAVFRMQVRLEVGPKSGSCLEVAMHSGNDLTARDVALSCDQVISANHNLNAGGGSMIHANVEAYGSIGGGIYTKSTRILTRPLSMPDPRHVLDYYTSSGTPISYTDLTPGNRVQMLINPSFEIDTSGWYLATAGFYTRIVRDGTRFKDGRSSLRVIYRSNSSNVAAQDIPPGALKSGGTYTVCLPILTASYCTARATMVLQSTGSGTQYVSTSSTNLTPGVWADLKGDLKPSWAGTLTRATLQITISNTTDYNIDAVSLYDRSYPDSSYVIDRKVLSPASNPFGSRQTNPEGIYIIHCGGKDVIIANSRIVGTLVLLDPGGDTAIQGSVHWEPAKPNYPAVLADRKITLSLGQAPLDEATLNANFNGTGTPYPLIAGATNTTTADTYPSRITGLIYSAGDLAIANAPTIAGIIVADHNIAISGTRLDLQYANASYLTPPPGFDVGQVPMKAVPGTWQRIVKPQNKP